MESLSGMDSWFGNVFGRTQVSVLGNHHCTLGSYHYRTVGAAADTAAAGEALNPCQAVSFHC